MPIFNSNLFIDVNLSKSRFMESIAFREPAYGTGNDSFPVVFPPYQSYDSDSIIAPPGTLAEENFDYGTFYGIDQSTNPVIDRTIFFEAIADSLRPASSLNIGRASYFSTDNLDNGLYKEVSSTWNSSLETAFQADPNKLIYKIPYTYPESVSLSGTDATALNFSLSDTVFYINPQQIYYLLGYTSAYHTGSGSWTLNGMLNATKVYLTGSDPNSIPGSNPHQYHQLTSCLYFEWNIGGSTQTINDYAWTPLLPYNTTKIVLHQLDGEPVLEVATNFKLATATIYVNPTLVPAYREDTGWINLLSTNSAGVAAIQPISPEILE